MSLNLQAKPYCALLKFKVMIQYQSNLVGTLSIYHPFMTQFCDLNFNKFAPNKTIHKQELKYKINIQLGSTSLKISFSIKLTSITVGLSTACCNFKQKKKRRTKTRDNEHEMGSSRSWFSRNCFSSAYWIKYKLSDLLRCLLRVNFDATFEAS